MAVFPFDLNEPAPSESDAVASADLPWWNMEPSRCDGRPPPRPPPQHAAAPEAASLSVELRLAPPRHQRQADGRRGKRSDSQDLDSPAPQRRRVFGFIQPHPHSKRRPPRSPSSEGSNTMESRTPPLHPSGSGAIEFTCSCGAKSRPTIEPIANGELKDELKDEADVECHCGKKYIIKLMSEKQNDDE